MGNTRSPDLDPIRAAVHSAVRQYGDALVGVACSGGPDSLVLADATMHAVRVERVVVITIDHGLSPGSAEVADGVAAWARARGASGCIERVDVARTASLEAAARDARYEALARFASASRLAAILMGHSSDDQAETVLMRILRGTSPAGLAAIPERRLLWNDIPVVRPLLAFTRAEIEAYVAAAGLTPWIDPMNADPSLQRVRIRSQILPALRAENPRLDTALVRLADSAAEWLEVIDDLARPFACFPGDCGALAQLKPAVRKRAVMMALDAAGIEAGTIHLEAIDALIRRSRDGEASIDLPGARLVRSYDVLELHIAGRAAPRIELVPPDGPYRLRLVQPGDRMRPARLKGRSRKLSDLFIDSKVPRSVRANARVLVRTTTSAIVWAEHLGRAHEEPENLVPTAKKPPE